jgi:hypothetical protein
MSMICILQRFVVSVACGSGHPLGTRCRIEPASVVRIRDCAPACDDCFALGCAGRAGIIESNLGRDPAPRRFEQ